MSKKIEKSIELGGRTLTISTGHIASQASGAVFVTYGETVVLATVVSAPLKAELDYFPLTVEYQERLYAGGRIKGSRWVKREGRPTDEEILSARLVDRSIRPLFPKEYKKDVQVMLTVLSVDMENPPDVVAGIAASAAIAISNIPWNGPVSMLKVGLKDGSYILNPTEIESEQSDLDLVVSCSKDAILMIEAGAKQVSEEVITKGIEFAQKESAKIVKLIEDLVKVVSPKKEAVEKVKISEALQKQVKKLSEEKIKELIKTLATKEAGYYDYDEVKNAVKASFTDEEKKTVAYIFDEMFKDGVREMILSGKRPDGRKPDEIRELTSEVSVLPRTHGSAIFRRGQTQALTIATLGAPSLEQLIETATGEESKRYIHHYSMPPYSTGETGRVGSPSRREIGHGALAERALIPVIPSEDVFPYTIRVVTEILSSNGSTSMASVCGSTLSLLDAGVPIIAPVAGIAMGLVIESEKKFAILTDIVGMEDGNGDMDFKVAGTKAGVTALQLDVKTPNLTVQILEKALAQAKEVRFKILDVIAKAISKPRESVSKYAPKIKVIRIEPEKIGELIGPGGKTIKRISAETNAQIDVDDDGKVFVSAMSEEDLKNAVEKVEIITKDPKPGEVYDGIVKRVQPFGAFVEIAPGKEGMVHVSDMSEEYVKDPSAIVSVGDVKKVRVKEIDELGRLNLSMVLDPAFDQRKEDRRRERRDDSGGSSRNTFTRRGQEGTHQRNDRRMGDRRRPQDDRRSGGPHFPTSRFIDNSKKKSF